MRFRRTAGWGAGIVALVLVGAVLIAYWTSTNACDDATIAVPGDRMKAVTYCDYGSPDVLQLTELARPIPDSGRVLVKVRAAAINPLDWHTMRGTPYVMRLSLGLRKPKDIRLGIDFSGIVDSVGSGVTSLQPGDEVFGARTGALAEYVAARADLVVRKPANVTFQQAAAVPVAAITALQGLRDQGKLQPGQKVLINGASGGVGTFAVQIAKSLGADVTGVCSTRNLDLVRSIGADHVIDYTKEDFTRGTRRYDLILDMVGNHPLRKLRRVLKPQGKYIMVGGRSGRWINPLPRVIRTAMLSWFVSQDLRFFLSDLNHKDLATLGELMQTGKVTPVIDRCYHLSDVAAAMRYLEAGHARGKVVISEDCHAPPE